MKSNLSITFFLFASCFFSAVFSATLLKKTGGQFKSLNMLEKLDFNTNFGKSLINILQLKLKTGGRLDDVLTLLDELESSLVTKKDELAADKRQKDAAWDQEIANYQGEVNRLTTENEDLNTKLGEKAASLKEHSETLEKNTKILEELKNNLQKLNEFWVDYDNKYNQGKSERERIIEALEQIIGLLEGKLTSNSFVQLKNLITNLKEISKAKNPILTLVELTMSFDVEAVQTIISKLKEIRDALAKANQEALEAYQKTKSDYDVNTAALQASITETEGIIQQESTTVVELRREAQVLDEQIKANENLIGQNKGLVETTTKAKEDYETTYNSNIAILDDEIETIRKVKTILKNNESNLRKND